MSHDTIEANTEGHAWRFGDVTLVGRSPVMERIAEVVTRVARRGSPAHVLIEGERGVGKNLIAHAIHACGPRRDRAFLKMNCAAVPTSLIGGELFGQETMGGAEGRHTRTGLFELASGGTLFLEEVGDVPMTAQAELLEVFETGSVRRVGGVRDISVDVHVVAATSRDLHEAAREGRFREDLLYLLDVVPIAVPPLRKRPEDIAPLAQHFLERMCAELSLPARRIAPEALGALESYDWPGNARELNNVLERILLLRDDAMVGVSSLPRGIHRPEGSEADAADEPFTLPDQGVDLDGVERDLIRQALERTHGNKSHAARLLGLSRDTLRYRVEKYGFDSVADDPKGRSEPR
jgi:two-component system, NtrC family, response regulator AtoC